MFYQKSTYWEIDKKDGFSQNTFLFPRTINTRWEHRQELFIDGEGEKSLSKSVIYSSEKLKIGSYIFLGESSKENPREEEKAYIIRAISVTPDLRNKKRIIKIWC